MHSRLPIVVSLCGWCFVLIGAATSPAQSPERPWQWTTARLLPGGMTNDRSDFFSMVEGKDGRLYISAGNDRHDAYLVEYDPTMQQMQVVVDVQRAIGSPAAGLDADAAMHTPINVGASGEIYFGARRGNPNHDRLRADDSGGYPMVYDPTTDQTRVYSIPIPDQQIDGIVPDEARGVAYLSTRPGDSTTDSAHFGILDLERGIYRNLMETDRSSGFITIDHLGRAYHPLRGGEIARYDPKTGKLERLKQTVGQTIDGEPPSPSSLLIDEGSNPINWAVSPTRRTLYAVPIRGNQLYSYDLAAKGDVLPGRPLGALCQQAMATECRALCVAPNGVVWAAVTATYTGTRPFVELVSYKPGDAAPIDRGPLAIGNPDYTAFADNKGAPLPLRDGVYRFGDGNLLPRDTVLGICATRNNAVYVITRHPLTLHELHVRPQRPVVSTGRKPIAGLTTTYHHNSHADLIMSRMVQTETLDGRGRVPLLRLASIYTDQVPKNDISRWIAGDLGIPILKRAGDTLTLGGDRVQVEGAMIVAEHGDYPESSTGQFMFPKRRLFAELFATLDRLGHRGLPVFCDKHLADTWADAKWIYDETKQRDMPLMAGSSVPSAWRDPPIDVPRGTKLREIHVLSFHRLDAFGFHALEAMQALAERRAGGESGVANVQTLVDDDVWRAADRGMYDRKLLDTALAALRLRPLPTDRRIEDLVKHPVLFVVDYRDGLRGCVFTLHGPVVEWAAAWKDDQDRRASTAFVTQEDRPFMHFAVQFNAIERFMITGQAPWPVERTLLTSGLLDELLISKQQGGATRPTPHLDLRYTTSWNWSQPINPPPDRPMTGQ